VDVRLLDAEDDREPQAKADHQPTRASMPMCGLTLPSVARIGACRADGAGDNRPMVVCQAARRIASDSRPGRKAARSGRSSRQMHCHPLHLSGNKKLLAGVVFLGSVSFACHPQMPVAAAAVQCNIHAAVEIEDRSKERMTIAGQQLAACLGLPV
jgi:hypothetical protein